MDPIDLRIAKILLTNCRITYRDISQTLDLSVNAIYKRVQNMIEAGVIRAFTAKPSLIGLKAVNVLVFGQSEGTNLNDISKELGSHESIYFVGNAGGNFLYIDGYLREISELNEYTALVSRNAKINVSKELDASASSAGDIYYKGNPEIKNLRSSSAGGIHKE